MEKLIGFVFLGGHAGGRSASAPAELQRGTNERFLGFCVCARNFWFNFFSSGQAPPPKLLEEDDQITRVADYDFAALLEKNPTQINRAWGRQEGFIPKTKWRYFFDPTSPENTFFPPKPPGLKG